MAEGGPLVKKHRDEETQGLEKVTDYVEEKENTAELGQVSQDLIDYTFQCLVKN